MIYVFFIKSSPDQGSLVLSPSNTSLPDANNLPADINIQNPTSLVARDFLTLLLNVKNIKLNDAVFSDPAFINLHDTPINLIPDGTEGRPNPFAQFGAENISAPLDVSNVPNTIPNNQTPIVP